MSALVLGVFCRTKGKANLIPGSICRIVDVAFENLLNEPEVETALLRQVAAFVQLNFSVYKDACFFLKLNKVHGTEKVSSDMGKMSEIVWERTFKDEHDQLDFFYDSVMQRACIMVKFRNGRYELFCQGFYLCSSLEVWSDRIEEHLQPILLDGNLESRKMVPRELFEKGFGEISSTLSLSKVRNAV